MKNHSLTVTIPKGYQDVHVEIFSKQTVVSVWE